jgi:hypothetical protein
MISKKKIIDIVVAAAFVLAAFASIFNAGRHFGFSEAKAAAEAAAEADCQLWLEQAPNLNWLWGLALDNFC